MTEPELIRELQDLCLTEKQIARALLAIREYGAHCIALYARSPEWQQKPKPAPNRREAS